MSSADKVVLIVDDNAGFRVALAALLRLFGLSVDTTTDGQAALDYLQGHPPPCLIVLDLRMPGMDGLQFLAVRERNPTISQIPVLVCSGEPEWMVGDRLGDAAFFAKGSDPMRLVQTVLALCA
jgi:CheY-like chemotaxis protein